MGDSLTSLVDQRRVVAPLPQQRPDSNLDTVIGDPCSTVQHPWTREPGRVEDSAGDSAGEFPTMVADPVARAEVLAGIGAAALFYAHLHLPATTATSSCAPHKQISDTPSHSDAIVMCK